MTTRENGSITALVVGLVATFIACAALVFDGGRIVSYYLRYADLAGNAARSGSQEIRSLRSGDPKIDPARAERAAHQYLNQLGVSGRVEIAKNTVIVTIDGVVEFQLLKLIGLSSTSIAVTRSAGPVIQ